MEKNRSTYQSGSEYSRPKLGRLLRALALDKQFIRGAGSQLFYLDSKGKEIAVSDYVGGYGSLLLGHHHPELKKLAIELIEKQLPNHAQMSSKSSVEELGQFISDEIGSRSGKKYITTLANSGAEAVEAAIKHARLNFSKKKGELLDRLHRQLHGINHHFVAGNKEFRVTIDGMSHANFNSFKDHCIQKFHEVYNAKSPALLALSQSFHGKTTGALNLTSHDKFRSGFQTNDREKSHVTFFEQTSESLTDALKCLQRTITLPKLSNGEILFDTVNILLCLGVIVEPIQGEGGIRPVKEDFLHYLREKTHSLKIPLIFDEIQCGSYRTGTLAHSIQHKVFADYYLFSKSFGGGMVKNAALVIDKKQYHEGFGVVHTSTYSDDEYSAKISLKALQIGKAQSETVLKKGRLLEEQLLKLQNDHPGVIKAVRGTGLMWGIEFFDLDFSENYSFQMFSRSGYLNYLYCSYLLNQWDIRLAPTLSDPHTLRVLPSIFISESDINTFRNSLDALSKIIQYRDFYKLIEHLVPQNEQHLRPLHDFGNKDVIIETNRKLNESVGFISHYINENGVRDGDPSMAVLSDETINAMLESVLEISVPIVLHAIEIKGTSGKSVNIYFTGMLFTAAMAREMMTKNLYDEYADLCNDAVDFLHKGFNCSLVGLGQYSSVILKNGKSVRNPDVAVTTGNSYTVGIGVQAIKEELSLRMSADQNLTLGVLGAAGNICSTYVKCFLPRFTKMILKGSDGKGGVLKTQRFVRELIVYIFSELLESERKIVSGLNTGILHPETYKNFVNSKTFEELKSGKLNVNDLRLVDKLRDELGSSFPFVVIETLEGLKECDVTVVATNHPEPFLYSRYFADNSIVYDISVPLNSTDELIHNNRNIKVIMGGVVELPYNQAITMRAYPLDKGEAFACISETILLGLEENMCNYSYGNLHPSQVLRMDIIGAKHGFKLKKNKLETIF
ncbi:MAG: aminotransferase class III-fold pyridoxal phosphate-dependent enzyme [Crocinitomicaceae bacterium]